MNAIVQPEHSVYGGSIFHRIALCPGSVRQSRGLPNIPSQWAEEGTAAHAQLALRLRRQATAKPPDSFVQIAVDYVEDILDEYPDAVLLVEHRFEIPSVAAPGEVLGTADVCIFVPSLRLLYVIDYKHGAGVAVEVAGNKQTRFYARGALPYFVTRYPNVTIDTVVLVIVQPRIAHPAGPIREEWVTSDEIWAFGAEIERTIAASLDPGAPLVPGKVQCQFCPAFKALACPAHEQRALAVVNETFTDISQIVKEALPRVATMSVDRMAYILDARDLVEAWFEEVYKMALALAKEGKKIPGRKVVEALAKRRFIDDETHLVEAATKIYGPATYENLKQIEAVPAMLSRITDRQIDAGVFAPPTLLGIGETEKLLKDWARDNAPKGMKKTWLEDISKKFALLTIKQSSGTLSLVSEKDGRSAVNMAEEAFSGLSALPKIELAS